MAKHFDKWNVLKQQLDDNSKRVEFKERTIYWISIGENIGFEQNGKGDIFSRPVLVLKKISKQLFFGIPLSTQIKEGSFFYQYRIDGQIRTALLAQGRTFDTKRLENKIGMMEEEDFKKLKEKFKLLLEL